jgi:hypothetical protein
MFASRRSLVSRVRLRKIWRDLPLLEKREIEQITNYFFAHQLAIDDEDRRERIRTVRLI